LAGLGDTEAFFLVGIGGMGSARGGEANGGEGGGKQGVTLVHGETPS
jgi:hypothetical protein